MERTFNVSAPSAIAQVEEMLLASWNIRKGDLHTRLQIAGEAVEMSDRIHYERGSAYGRRNRGALLKLLDRPDSALDDLNGALNLFRQMEDLDGEASAYTELGITYQDIGQYTQSLENLLSAKYLYQLLQDEPAVARTLTNIGNLYLRLEQFEKASEMYEQAFSLHEKHGKRRGALRAKCNLGLTYLRRGQHAKAIELALQAIPGLQHDELHLDVCSAYITVAEAYCEQEHYALADQYLKQAWELANIHDFKRGIAALCHLFGHAYVRRNEVDEARQWLEKGLVLSEELHSPDLAVKCLVELSEVFEQQQDFQQALKFRKEASRLRSDLIRQQYAHLFGMREVLSRREQAESDRHLLEAKNIELENANHELARLSEHKDEMLGIVSHDMRTPLGTIIGMGNLLRTEGAENMEEVREMGSMIEQSGQRLLVLVNTLLETYRAEHTRVSLATAPSSLADLIRSAVTIYQPLATRKNISLSVEMPPLPELIVDPAKIGQVFANVLSNAVKFTPHGGNIAINAATLPDNYLRVEFADSGIGMPSEYLDHVFEKFGKHQRRGTDGERGTGLGMPIVKRFVELHQGRVTVDSKENQGTKVCIDLPIPSGT